MSLLNTIDQISQHEPKEFIAPVMTKYAKVFTLQDGIPYWFHIQVGTPGWFLLQPNSFMGLYATVIRKAMPHEMIQYLAELPSFRVIILFPVDETTQLVMPFNLSDAAQRGWKNGVPRHMHIVYHNLQHKQVVQAAAVGDSLVFNRASHLTINSTGKRESRIATEIYEARLNLIRKREVEEKRAAHVKTEQGRLETALEFMGASLEDWTRELDGYIVRWMIDGQMYRMEVDTNLRVKSAGVCLDQTDNWHSLSSVVAVMQDRQKAIDADEHGDY